MPKGRGTHLTSRRRPTDMNGLPVSFPSDHVRPKVAGTVRLAFPLRHPKEL